MGILKKWQNRGLGKALLNQLIDELKANQVDHLALLTNRGILAEASYQKSDFKEISHIVFYAKEI